MFAVKHGDVYFPIYTRGLACRILQDAEGIRTSWQRTTLLVMEITLQNMPEGLAVAAPLRWEGVLRLKSFWYGQLSAVVEPVAGVLGAAAVGVIYSFLTYRHLHPNA